MSKFAELNKIKISDYPSDFIPNGAVPFFGLDSSKDCDCVVVGFYDVSTAEYHIQRVDFTEGLK